MTQTLQFLGAATVTSLATFAYYSAFASLAGNGAMTVRDGIARAAASIVVGTFLTVHARRDAQTAGAAAADGFALGIIVVVCNSLFGSDFAGNELAIRTTGILTGVPALAVVSQLLAKRGTQVGRGAPFTD